MVIREGERTVEIAASVVSALSSGKLAMTCGDHIVPQLITGQAAINSLIST